MHRDTDPRYRRFQEAYLLMAKQARYRPEAPGDGLGNVCLSPEEAANSARLQVEAEAYARAFVAEDNDLRFFIGCSDYTTGRAFAWTIEAARALAGAGNNELALRLLKMAAQEVERAGQGEGAH